MSKNSYSPEIEKIRRAMEKELPAGRYTHTLGVAFTASCLAMAHGINDLESTMTAGLLHDCAKAMHGSEMVSICEKFHLNMTAVERNNPTSLLHAKVGAYLAEHKYGVKDADILNAIRYHTTGRPNMGRLEKIIFIADYIEPSRKQIADLDYVRRLAYQDLDRTMEKILADTLAYLQKKDDKIDEMTVKTYHYYKIE